MFMILIFWSILQSILHVYYFFWEGKGESDLKRLTLYSLQPLQFFQPCLYVYHMSRVE